MLKFDINLLIFLLEVKERYSGHVRYFDLFHKGPKSIKILFQHIIITYYLTLSQHERKYQIIRDIYW